MTTKILKRLFILAICAVVFGGCGKSAENYTESTAISVSTEELEDNLLEEELSETSEEETKESPVEEFSFALEDGVYMVDFDTDSSMFHVNEAYEGKAKLSVEKGQAMLHLVMPSKNVLNLFLGLAEDAKAEGALLIEPSTEEVTYSDGYTEEVFTFDVPVTVYDQEFDLALIGKKEVWYDHKVKISNATEYTEKEEIQTDIPESGNDISEGDTIQVPVSLQGGTGKVTLESPTKVEKTSDGYLVTLVWSSKHYDYMIVDGVKYFPVDTNEHSVFEIPVADISLPLNVIADTVAMSTPHEIEYVITFDSESIQ